MKVGTIFCSLVFTLLTSVVCFPQVKKYESASPSAPVVARVSYQNLAYFRPLPFVSTGYLVQVANLS